jgi:hypothetical protein
VTARLAPVAPAAGAAAAGRMCPVDYCYEPSVFDRPAEIAADVLYVVGGLYGNLAALAAVEQLAEGERAPVTIVFNGDFHWFDAEPAWFDAIETGVKRHAATRGNVETEIARSGDIGAGCGCAYPDSVADAVVARSNEILQDVRAAASGAARMRLAALPMHMVGAVGGLRVGIVHGDAAALAGWRFDAGALDDPANRSWLADIRAQARIDVFASTHTSLAALRDLALPGGRLTVINNGAAGMPNFSGSQFGLISRLATQPSRHVPVYGTSHDGIHIDALAIHYDTAAFLDRFLARWPAGSAAHASYFRRIIDGPDHAIMVARP